MGDKYNDVAFVPQSNKSHDMWYLRSSIVNDICLSVSLRWFNMISKHILVHNNWLLPVLGLWCLTPLWTIFQLYRGKLETGVPRENHWPAASHWQTLSHNVVSSTPRLSGIRTHNVSRDRHSFSDCISSSDYSNGNDWSFVFRYITTGTSMKSGIIRWLWKAL